LAWLRHGNAELMLNTAYDMVSARKLICAFAWTSTPLFIDVNFDSAYELHAKGSMLEPKVACRISNVLEV